MFCIISHFHVLFSQNLVHKHSYLSINKQIIMLLLILISIFFFFFTTVVLRRQLSHNMLNILIWASIWCNKSLYRLKHGGKEPSHMPGHIYGTAFLKTSRIVNHLSHLRITWKLTCLLIVNFVILFMCKSCLLSSLFFIAPWALCRVDLAHYKSYELLLLLSK